MKASWQVYVKINEEEMPDLSSVDIVIAGINEFRGAWIYC